MKTLMSFLALFERQVQVRPDDTAVVFEGASKSYTQLNGLANRVAKRLLDGGIGRGDVVALLRPRDICMLVSILAIFKCGASYVPIEPNLPPRRILSILQQCRCRGTLTSPDCRGALQEIGPTAIVGVVEEWIEAGPLWINPNIRCDVDDLAYVIFTSGSTGQPKGAMVSQFGMCNHLLAKVDVLNLDHLDVVAQTASQSFDISVWQFLAPLVVGARTVIIGAQDVMAVSQLVDRLTAERATILEAVPSQISVLIDHMDANPKTEQMSDLRWMISTGEALPASLARRWFHARPHVPLLNAYGPTECSDDITHHVLRTAPPQSASAIPIGREIRNCQIHVLDEQMAPVPPGEKGQLCVSGTVVGLGYINDPARTAEAFVPDPLSDREGGRLYKTGDLGRRLSDGTIEFLGRLDNQVKIRGHRIELGEIERTLDQHPSIRQSACIIYRQSSGRDLLVAFLSSTEGTVQRDADEGQWERYRAHLMSFLPAYMIPNRFVSLEVFPLTPNGKVDRKALLSVVKLLDNNDVAPAYVRLESTPLTVNGKLDREALPAPGADAYAHTVQGHKEPTGEIETALVILWEQLLSTAPIGVTDDFFALGGNSMLAVQFLAQIEQMSGRTLPLTTLFEASTIEQLGDVIRRDGPDLPGPTVIPIQPRGSKPALFCVSQPNVNALGYVFLARYLGTDLPVYGLQGSLPENRFDNVQFEVMATKYIEAMRTVQPNGPYLLIGYCHGGLIAFEMARQLERLGQSVAMLALLDVWAEENTRNPFLFYTHRWIQRLIRLTKMNHAEQVVLLSRKVSRLSGLLTRGPSPAPTTAAIEHTGESVASIYFPSRRYRPPSCESPITAFRVAKQLPYRVRDRQMGWGKRTRGGVEVIDIPGEHDTILSEPHVRVLAARMAVCINTVLETHPESPPRLP
jgi:amino acid adenylation domain-containing protein